MAMVASCPFLLDVAYLAAILTIPFIPPLAEITPISPPKAKVKTNIEA